MMLVCLVVPQQPHNRFPIEVTSVGWKSVRKSKTAKTGQLVLSFGCAAVVQQWPTLECIVLQMFGINSAAEWSSEGRSCSEGRQLMQSVFTPTTYGVNAPWNQPLSKNKHFSRCFTPLAHLWFSNLPLRIEYIRKLEVFRRRYLRRILKISGRKNLCRNIKQLYFFLQRRPLQWLGHIIIRPDAQLPQHTFCPIVFGTAPEPPLVDNDPRCP